MRRATFILSMTFAAGSVTCVALAQQPQNMKSDPVKQQQNKQKPASKSASPIRPGGGRKSVNTDPTAPERYARFRAAMQPVEAAQLRARLLLRSGDFDGAEQAAREAITLSAGLSQLPQEEGRRLIGQIRMRQGLYKEALEWLGADWQAGEDAGRDLEVALCYVRLGNYQRARRFYSDQLVLRYVPQDQRDNYGRSMPSVATLRGLEASILFARGNESTMSTRHLEALADFDAAGTLSPTNGLIAYCAGMSLVHLNRSDEAALYFRRAAQYGRGKILEMAQERAAAYPDRTTAPQQAPQ